MGAKIRAMRQRPETGVLRRPGGLTGNGDCTRVQAGGTTAVVFLALAGLGGCHKPPAVLTNEVLTPAEKHQKLLFSRSDEAEALAAMQSVAAGRVPVNPPASAPKG